MINLNVKARKNERKDGYAIEFTGKIYGNPELVKYEIAEILEKFDELTDGETLVDALDIFMSRKLARHCDKCEGCNHEDD